MSALDYTQLIIQLQADAEACRVNDLPKAAADIERAIIALAASPKGQVEPVAWADPHTIGSGWPYVSKTRSDAHTMPLYASPAPEERIQIAERLITEYHEHCMAAGKSSIEYPAGLQHQASAFLAGRPVSYWMPLPAAPSQVEPEPHPSE